MEEVNVEVTGTEPVELGEVTGTEVYVESAEEKEEAVEEAEESAEVAE